jgi:hypothetical protein
MPDRPPILWLTTGLGIAQICSWGSIYYSFPLIAEGMRPISAGRARIYSPPRSACFWRRWPLIRSAPPSTEAMAASS